MPPRGKKKTKSAARKTKRTVRSRAGASRKTSARKTASSRKPAAKRSAKRTARRTARPAAKRSASSRKPPTAARRIPAQTAAIAPAFGGGIAGDEQDEIIILSTDELIDETDIDLGGDEGGGDDDLDGM